MVNINLVCQSVPKEPLQARVSKGAVATAITACGFVTFKLVMNTSSFGIIVATAITACGFVTAVVEHQSELVEVLQQRLPLAVL